MNYLIVGGNGFIGKNLSETILKHSPKSNIFILDKKLSNSNESNSRIRFIKKEEKSLLNNLIRLDNKIDTIIHLGGISTPYEGINVKKLIDFDLSFTIELLEWAKLKEVSKFVYFSSGGTIYGSTKSKMGHNENDLPFPKNNYALVKCLNELLIQKECQESNICHLIIRPSNPYGPGQVKFNKQGVISTFLYRLIRNQTLETYGSLQNTKDYIYIGDLCYLVYKLLKNNKCGIYNVGSGLNTSLEEILKTVEKVTKTKIKNRNNQLKQTQIPYFALDNRKLLKDILENYEFKTLEKGIEETWKWMKAQNFNHDQ